MALRLASWQMRFIVGMDEVLNLWLLRMWVNAYAVSERFFFWILIPAYVARNICQNNFRRMNVLVPTCKSSATERMYY